MKFRRPAVAIALCLAWFSLSTQRAKADLTLVFSPTSSVSIQQDEVVQIQIRLDGTSNLSSQGGLNGFGIKGTLSPGLAFEPLFVSGTSPFEFAAPFTGPVPTIDATNPNAVTFTLSTSGTVQPGAMGSSILLGTVALRGTAPGTSTITISDLNASPNFLTGAGVVGLDTDIFGSSLAKTYSVSVNVSAVPEPGSMSLVALASGGLWLARRRFRRAK